jgi:hypothetical protein
VVAGSAGARLASQKLDTLFCFVLMLPFSYEVGLIHAQLDLQAGIFACDSTAVYSNQSITMSSQISKASLETQIVPGSLHCEIGGRDMTALNTEIFVRVWKKVMSGSEFSEHSWTVKTDPDAVIIPWRLRLRAGRSRFLHGLQDKVYMNTCSFGHLRLHGSLEMMSLGAMRAYRDGIDRCVQDLTQDFSQFGEDVFLVDCLTLLGVDHVDDFGMMKDSKCDLNAANGRAANLKCGNGRAAYHPFKTVGAWVGCHRQSEDGALTDLEA